MSNSLIVSSQTINISYDQKIEVVSTLIAYPLVLNELSLTNQLLDNCKETNKIYADQIDVYKENENLYKAQIKVLEQQNKLFNIELKKEKLNKFKSIGVGILAVGASVLIFN